MTFNLWTLLNTPRIQLTVLDELIISLYIIVAIVSVYVVFYYLTVWSIERDKKR